MRNVEHIYIYIHIWPGAICLVQKRSGRAHQAHFYESPYVSGSWPRGGSAAALKGSLVSQTNGAGPHMHIRIHMNIHIHLNRHMHTYTYIHKCIYVNMNVKCLIINYDKLQGRGMWAYGGTVDVQCYLTFSA